MHSSIETRSDCSRCAALCCIAFPAEAVEGFAVAKHRGEPCPQLAAGGQCKIYDRRAEEGFAGCIGFECFGAGQYVTELLGGSAEWQDDPALLARMVDQFLTIRRLFELLWLARHAQQAASAAKASEEAAQIEAALRKAIAANEPMAVSDYEDRLRRLLRGQSSEA